MNDLFFLVLLVSFIAILAFIVLGIMKRNKKHYKKAGISLIVLIVSFVGFIMTDTNGGEEVEKELETAQSKEADELYKDEKENENEKEIELTTEEKIKEIAEEVFGNKLIDFEYIEDRNYYKIYSETSGLSVKMDKSGTQYDTSDLLKEIQDLDFKNIYVEYQAEFVDNYGNSEKREGIFYEFSKETVDKINFDNFLPGKLPEVADQYWQHPAFD